jgi:hypothetical protein
MKKIQAFITTKEDFPEEFKAASFIMELYDFREYTPDYTEGNRKKIKEFYERLLDMDCHVIFSFEIPSQTERTALLEECNRLIKSGLSINALKKYKEETGCSLTEAKQVLNIGPNIENLLS